MIGAKPSATDPARVLVVADGDAEAQAIVACFGETMPKGHVATDPSRLLADAAQTAARRRRSRHGSLDVAVRQALALRAVKTVDAGSTYMLLLCASADAAAAARLCREGVFDDYVQHFPAPNDRRSPRRQPAHRPAASPSPTGRGAAARRSADRARRRRRHLLAPRSSPSTLETRGVDLVFEADGASALERIVTVRPDLVLMDVMLPGRDGVDLTHSIKADPMLAGIPVVMLTGEARREALVRSMEAGAADFIVKPFTPDALRRQARQVPAVHCLTAGALAAAQADVTGMPRNWPATAAPAGRG